MSKICSLRDKGGFGLLDPRLYYILLEMAKLAKHWNKDNQLEWVIIENNLSSPFTPIDRLSQSAHKTLNPIMSHSREIWIKIHKMHKLSHCKQTFLPYGITLWLPLERHPCIGKNGTQRGYATLLIYMKKGCSWHFLMVK